MQVHAGKRSKLKHEHALIEGLRPLLESIAPWEDIHSIIPGRIRPTKGSKRQIRQDPFRATPPDSFGLEPNTEIIGIAGQSGKWKDGCARPSSSTSRALPKKSSCRRPRAGRPTPFRLAPLLIVAIVFQLFAPVCVLQPSISYLLVSR